MHMKYNILDSKQKIRILNAHEICLKIVEKSWRIIIFDNQNFMRIMKYRVLTY